MSDGTSAKNPRYKQLDRKIRSVQCLNCGIEHDRDEHAAKNINKVGIGHCHDSKRTQREGKTTKEAHLDEVSRIPARSRRGVCQRPDKSVNNQQ